MPVVNGVKVSKIWAPFVQGKTVLMYKENLFELLDSGDEVSVNILIPYIRKILFHMTDHIVNAWMEEYNGQ